MAQLIESGVFQSGQRLPSVRDTAAQEGVSISTAMQAFRWLEDKGLAQAKPKTGYFVRKNRQRIALPLVGQPPAHSMPVERRSRSDVVWREGLDEVAVVETLITVSAFNKSGSFNLIHTDKDGRMFTRLVQVMVKKMNSWKIISYHNVDIKEGIAIPELV